MATAISYVKGPLCIVHATILARVSASLDYPPQSLPPEKKTNGLPTLVKKTNGLPTLAMAQQHKRNKNNKKKRPKSLWYLVNDALPRRLHGLQVGVRIPIPDVIHSQFLSEVINVRNPAATVDSGPQRVFEGTPDEAMRYQSSDRSAG